HRLLAPVAGKRGGLLVGDGHGIVDGFGGEVGRDLKVGHALALAVLGALVGQHLVETGQVGTARYREHAQKERQDEAALYHVISPRLCAWPPRARRGNDPRTTSAAAGSPPR